jgi:hypothetical protein
MRGRIGACAGLITDAQWASGTDADQPSPKDQSKGLGAPTEGERGMSRLAGLIRDLTRWISKHNPYQLGPASVRTYVVP